MAVAIALGVGLPCSATAAAAGWRIDALSNTTAAPGGTLDHLVQVTNVAETASDGGPVALVARLPPGVTAVSTANESAGASFACSGPRGAPVAGASVVTCAETGVVARRDVRVLRLTVAIDPGATGTLTSAFEVSGGGLGAASTVDPTRIAAGAPDFGVDAFDGQVTDSAGDPFAQAAGHPFAISTSIDFNTGTNPDPPFGPLWPVEPAKDVRVELPPGFVADPLVASTCTEADVGNTQGGEPAPLCAPTSQVGTALVRRNDLPGPVVLGPLPLFALPPAPGELTRFGFDLAGTVVTLGAELRGEPDRGLTLHAAELPQGLAVAGMSLTLWGVPSDASHDAERGCPGQPNPWRDGPSCSSGSPRKAFLRTPTFCDGPDVGAPTTLGVASWTHPGVLRSRTFLSHLPPAYPSPPSQWGAELGTTGCGSVPFDASVTAGPASSVQAGQPLPFSFAVGLPQSDDPDALGQADLQWADIGFPEGVGVSPAGTNGFAGCSPAQIGLDSTADPTCPAASRIGSATIATPLVEQPLTGSVYLATPIDNPFGSEVVFYLVAQGPGLSVKLPWAVDEDPETGELSAFSDDFPQLPLSSVQLELSGGPHAWMTSPNRCGVFTTYALAASWNGDAVESESSFAVSEGAGGGPCPTPTPAPPAPAPPAPGPATAPPPAPFAPAPAFADTTAPSFTASPAFSPRRFRVAGGATPTGAARRAPQGSRLDYALSEPATVTIVVERATAGRRVAGECRPPKRANRGRSRCTRWTSVGTLTRTGLQGTNAVPFTGRIGHRPLPTGSYRATVTVRDAAGNRSPAKPAAFAIVP